MKSLFLVAFLSTISICFASESYVGTITLEGESIVFRFRGGQTKYEAMKPTGMTVTGYEKKSQMRNDKEIDISELHVELASGEKFALVEGKPVTITRVTSGVAVEWRIGQK